jgi:hypothetical protein
MENREGFYWERHPEVESLVIYYLERYAGKNRFLDDFGERLARQTSSGLINWVDHIRVPDSPELRRKLKELGFERSAASPTPVFVHSGVLLPALAPVAGDSDAGVALRADSIESFSRANGFEAAIEGAPLSPYRRALVAKENGVGFWVVERRGTRDFDPVSLQGSILADYERGLESWASLEREDADEDRAWSDRSRIARELVAKYGSGPAAHIVCRCERDYWLGRNTTGRVQKERQDTLGVGWANGDHLTFRSSRRNFSKLINLFLTLGFRKRERFYAGKEAGWGAQVMEHPEAALALFLDVDLDPEEIDIDFSERELKERDALGTVGLWCALHGDSIFGAGMHHLAARFDFERLIEDCAAKGIRFMPPFSNFSYLKQAFSSAEIWQVAPGRVRTLLGEKRIDDREAEKFLEQGSVGSHLEDIERKEGYKGFNRKNVSAIIRDTDPRKGL